MTMVVTTAVATTIHTDMDTGTTIIIVHFAIIRGARKNIMATSKVHPSIILEVDSIAVVPADSMVAEEEAMAVAEAAEEDRIA